jgi:hypothetical protein
MQYATANIPELPGFFGNRRRKRKNRLPKSKAAGSCFEIHAGYRYQSYSSGEMARWNLSNSSILVSA